MSSLADLQRFGFLKPAHLAFARTMAQLCPDLHEYVLLAAALASRSIEAGSACVDLTRLPLQCEFNGDQHVLQWPSPGVWRQQLLKSELVAHAGNGEARPLYFDGTSRVYLERYFQYEATVAAFIKKALDETVSVDSDWLGRQLGRFFPGRRGLDHQAAAAALALRSPLTIVSGGPGTGKTTVVTRILAMMIEWARSNGQPDPQIALLAPTGKASARLLESIQEQRRTMPGESATLNAIPTEASTLHRYLGFQPYAPTEFAHYADNPVSADIVVVDEGSMVDLPLLAKLLAALRPNARLIILGDHDQLVSVEVGTVLGDLVPDQGSWICSESVAQYLAPAMGLSTDVFPTRPSSGIWDHVVVLERSYRFDKDRALGRLAQAVRSGSRQQTQTLFEQKSDGVVIHQRLDDRAFRGCVVQGFSPLFEASSTAEMLARLNGFRVLCAHRRGPFGAEQINRTIERMLEEAGHIDRKTLWYDGRPVMVARNDYQLGLFNGDMGVCVHSNNGDMRVAFADHSDGSVRHFSPIQLPTCETAFALTVHKSQGSEFERVALVFPEQVSQVMTRELVYTALTRARQQVTVFGPTEVICAAVGRRVERASGLRQRFWAPSESPPGGHQLNLFDM